jgi:signal transduction protein with GAF and PtsI domain
MTGNLQIILDKKEKELKILHKVAEYISSDLELEKLLEHIVEIAIDLTSADSCFIYIFDPKIEELTLKASKNPHADEIDSIKLKKGEGIAGWVAEEKKPVCLTSGAYKDARFKGFTDLPEDKYEALLSVPILSKDEVVGVLNVQNMKEHDYREEQVNLLFSIAHYLGSAIRNVIFHNEIEKKFEQIDILSRISSTITSDGYLNEILYLIVNMTAQVMNSKICSIMLLDEKKQELIITYVR